MFEIENINIILIPALLSFISGVAVTVVPVLVLMKLKRTDAVRTKLALDKSRERVELLEALSKKLKKLSDYRVKCFTAAFKKRAQTWEKGDSFRLRKEDFSENMGKELSERTFKIMAFCHVNKIGRFDRKLKRNLGLLHALTINECEYLDRNQTQEAPQSCRAFKKKLKEPFVETVVDKIINRIDKLISGKGFRV